MQFKWNEWMKYINVLPNDKNANMGSSTVYLHGVNLIDMQIQDWWWKHIFILYNTHKYMWLVSVETLQYSFTRISHNRCIY